MKGDSMATFEQAIRHWAQQINDWYGLHASDEEVAQAFERDYKDKIAYDGTSYVEMFFKTQGAAEWSKWLDTADREGLADSVEILRGNPPLPTYGDLGGNLLNKMADFTTHKDKTGE
tara:strand:+ start:1757 stop:2107 length:351 start_codon:yes stop_codon:yes gene_type:complete